MLPFINVRQPVPELGWMLNAEASTIPCHLFLSSQVDQYYFQDELIILLLITEFISPNYQVSVIIATMKPGS